MGNPLVTIWCTVYNHKEYIEDAIQGFLNQKTDFTYEILIHDDCSTDGTTEILRDYERRYPEQIRVLYEEENLIQKGRRQSKKERIQLLKDVYHGYEKEIRGKYMAICEGDDFWVDSLKLQVQVSYMEENPDCLLTGTNGLQLDCRNNKMIPMSGFDEEKDVSIEEILLHKKMNFPTASMVLRKELYFRQSPYFECRVGDWMFQIKAALDGKVHYFDRITAVYRYFHSNSWSQNTYNNDQNYVTHLLDMIRFFDQFKQITRGRFDKQVSGMVDDYYHSAAMHMMNIEIKDEQEFISEIYNNLYFYEEEYAERLLKMREKAKKEKEDILLFCQQYDKVYVMGTGDGGHMVMRRFALWDIPFDGFVVSNNQPLKGEFIGKKVIHLRDIPQNEKIGIVIAIQRKLKTEIESALEESQKTDYIWASV